MPFFIMIVAFALLNSCDSHAFTITNAIAPSQRIELTTPDDWRSAIKQWIRSQLDIPEAIHLDEFKVQGYRLAAIHAGVKYAF